MASLAGTRVPSVILRRRANGAIDKLDAAELFGKGRSILFGVPGAFTPTCSSKHLPGFVELINKLKTEGGVDGVVACVSVNDAFVMKAWGEVHNAQEAGIDMLADGNGDLAEAMGLKVDKTEIGFGFRSKRFAAIIQDGVFTSVDVDDAGLDASSAESILNKLKA